MTELGLGDRMPDQGRIVTPDGVLAATRTAQGASVSAEWVRFGIGMLVAFAGFWYGFGNRISVVETRQDNLQKQFDQSQQRADDDRRDIKLDLREMREKIDRLLEAQQKRVTP